MANLTRWNPRSKLEVFEPFRSAEQRIEGMWRNWPSRWFGRIVGGQMLRPAMDVIENGSTVTVRVDLPGFKPKDVHIEVSDNLLTITGEMSDSV